MLIGYGRTSTLDQKTSIEAQLRDLQAAGCEKVFSEQVSSVDVVKREQLALALDFIREGDCLVVSKLDRLARSVAHLLSIVEQINKKRASLRILNLGVDTSTPTGKLMLTMLGGIAQFEREIMLERQREGIARARALGKYQGRKPTARAKAAEVLRLKGNGLGAIEIAKSLGLGRASVYRILATEQK
jgi:DNA invertase Pin-like site-specific DNA recombinase